MPAHTNLPQTHVSTVDKTRCDLHFSVQRTGACAMLAAHLADLERGGVAVRTAEYLSIYTERTQEEFVAHGGGG